MKKRKVFSLLAFGFVSISSVVTAADTIRNTVDVAGDSSVKNSYQAMWHGALETAILNNGNEGTFVINVCDGLGISIAPAFGLCLDTMTLAGAPGIVAGAVVGGVAFNGERSRLELE